MGVIKKMKSKKIIPIMIIIFLIAAVFLEYVTSETQKQQEIETSFGAWGQEIIFVYSDGSQEHPKSFFPTSVVYNNKEIISVVYNLNTKVTKGDAIQIDTSNFYITLQIDNFPGRTISKEEHAYLPADGKWYQTLTIQIPMESIASGVPPGVYNLKLIPGGYVKYKTINETTWNTFSEFPQGSTQISIPRDYPKGGVIARSIPSNVKRQNFCKDKEPAQTFKLETSAVLKAISVTLKVSGRYNPDKTISCAVYTVNKADRWYLTPGTLITENKMKMSIIKEQHTRAIERAEWFVLDFNFNNIPLQANKEYVFIIGTDYTDPSDVWIMLTDDTYSMGQLYLHGQPKPTQWAGFHRHDILFEMRGSIE